MKFPEQFRWSDAPHGYASTAGDGFGVFRVPGREVNGRALNVIACDGMETGWEHVSVTVGGCKLCPSWLEMCVVKALFWDDFECVVQFHPPEDEYVNQYAGCLHLWKCVAQPFPIPPSILVGIKP